MIITLIRLETKWAEAVVDRWMSSKRLGLLVSVSGCAKGGVDIS